MRSVASRIVPRAFRKQNIHEEGPTSTSSRSNEEVIPQTLSQDQHQEEHPQQQQQQDSSKRPKKPHPPALVMPPPASRPPTSLSQPPPRPPPPPSAGTIQKTSPTAAGLPPTAPAVAATGVPVVVPPTTRLAPSVSVSSATAPAPPSSLHKRSASGSILKKQTPSLESYMATTPITRHYELNQLVLAAFDSHYQAGLYQVAYAMGLQFVETALLEIPKHGYFYAPKHERQRMQSALDACRVAGLLMEIQDLQPPGRTNLPNERPRILRLQQLAMDQVHKASQDQYEQQRKAAEQEFRPTADNKNKNLGKGSSSLGKSTKKGSGGGGGGNLSNQEWVLLEPFLSCQESLSSVLCPPNGTGTAARGSAAALSPTSIPFAQSAAAVIQTGQPVYLSSRNDTSFLPLANTLEPFQQQQQHKHSRSEMSPVSRPNLLEQGDDWVHVRRQTAEDILLEKALYLSGLEILPTVSTDDDMSIEAQVVTPIEDDQSDHAVVVKHEQIQGPTGESQKRASMSSKLQLVTLSRLYHEDFDALVWSMGRIHVLHAHTYQGRKPGSTNGCTVIAPLLCIHYLILDEGDCHQGLDADMIVRVIDEETPAILAELRESLGLTGQAFLIPSDVHSYFMDNGQLHTQQFVNVVGGNILDETHLQTLIEALSDHKKYPRLAATLFFHQHVVAILKVPLKDGRGCFYDIIDSLPLKDTVQRVNESNFDFCRRHGLDTLDEYELNEERYLDRTIILRCHDSEALTACLRWYACSKFTEENMQYIDNYDEWDGNDFFDPRVYQAFLWGPAPTTCG